MGGRTKPSKSAKRATRIIFLDIDGVLNCASTENPRKLPYVVDRRLLKRFIGLLQRTKAKVVLSSTWRYDPAGLFSAKYWGIPFIDTIPDMPKKPRVVEIKEWLKQHRYVDRFVVIDDEDDELDELPLFQPSSKTGITHEIVRGVEDYLSGRTNEDMRCNKVERFIQNVQARLKGHIG
jgi:HAD domain in Swiss Army Knife RNA repair proteins